MHLSFDGVFVCWVKTQFLKKIKILNKKFSDAKNKTKKYLKTKKPEQITSVSQNHVLTDSTIHSQTPALMVSYIIGSEDYNDCQISLSDYNFDNIVNVVDVVAIVNYILR